MFTAPWESDVSNAALAKTLSRVNTTDFVAYDPKFFNIIGPSATIEHYLLDVDSNKLKKIVPDPPTVNAHGCVHYDGKLHVVTDGSRDNETGALVQIDPHSLKKKVLLNNFFVQPFAGFNDQEMDRAGNFWLTDSRSAADGFETAYVGREVVDLVPPTNPSIYFVEAHTMRAKVVWTTTGNANGVAVVPDSRTIYVPDTGVSKFRPSKKNPYGNRQLRAFTVSKSGSVLPNQRILGSPISYFYDGIRASREEWLFAGSGNAVDVIDPETGLILGSIGVGGGENVAASVAFGRNELWIVGRGGGGVWHDKNLKARLQRDW
ncbi:hypothetical protein NUU61_005024 [Penicillium alfredii]|uniref:SMP-30/Gluconolactonase/LRE-like region domain-containing protein n=1 Tax=Penicillium alfredii TaxID=1506179 RepID=A0A9W9K771_9EURO|nr:uncharacterized protein NUU61_005024 [Penicillium alfredii]KAJ5095668.1 hypothetical protein NUU61_005024 [Penicillium alfredii]